MTAQTLDQKRARHALACVKKIEGRAGNYVSYVNALPAAILMNGLGQALATELAAAGKDKDDPHRLLAKHVAGWLLSAEARTRYVQPSGGEGANTDDVQKLLHRIVEGDQRAYLRAQAEAIAYLGWLKKFANAFLKTPESGDGG